MTLQEWATIASPVVVVIGMVFTAFWTTRERDKLEATNDAKRDASLGELRKSFESAIAEFKVSNDRNAQHEIDCALFRGSTLKALEALAASAQAANTLRERMAAHEERLNSIDDSIEWSQRRFEELFRGQAALSKGMSLPTVDEEVIPRPPPRRSPHRGRLDPG